MSNLIDGKLISAAIRAEVRTGVEARSASGKRIPFLSVVLVGDDPASHSYVRGKTTAAEEAGIASETLRFPVDLSEADLLEIVAKLNADLGVDGILVQLPLPAHIDENKIIAAIHPGKDVDGFHPINVGNVALGRPGFAPCTPAGILEMLRRSGIATAGTHAVVLGRSNIVGRPMASLLMSKGVDATVTVCHSRTRDLASVTRQADLLVAAIGKAHFVTANMVKEGAVVIDVGINRVDDPGHPRGYRLVGDVDFEGVRDKASWITPVPGGVGPMTIAMLLKNTLEAAQRSDDV